jgi:putative oxidoreductase
MFKHYENAVSKIKNCASVPLLLARMTIGVIFMQAGYGKLTHLSSATEFFVELGIPFPELNVILASSTELVGGALILLGLFTRVVSLPLIGVMIVAIATAQLGSLNSLQEVLGLQEWDYIVILTILFVSGAGKISIDHLLRKYCAKG